jgi:hypothetical protein
MDTNNKSADNIVVKPKNVDKNTNSNSFEITPEERKALNAVRQELSPVDNSEQQNTLPPELQKALDKQAELELKYGDRTGEAAALGAARGLTIGLSDVALEKILGAERIREIKERNKAASITSELVTTAAPLLATGGTGAIAKALQVGGAGVIGTSKAAVGLGKLSEKGLQKILGKEYSKKAVGKILEKSVPTAVTGAAEGATYSVGQLISEDALGTAEFNGENLLSYGGSGALLGGAAGGILGAIPGLTKAAVSGSKSMFDDVAKKTKLGDPKKAASELLGKSDAEQLVMIQRAPDVYDSLPDYAVNVLGKENLSSPSKLAQAVSKNREESGRIIGETVENLSNAVREMPELAITKRQFYGEMADLVDDKIRQLESPNIAGMTKHEIKTLKKHRNSWLSQAESDDIITPAEIFKFKQDVKPYAKFDKATPQNDARAQINRDASRLASKKLQSLAESLSNVPRYSTEAQKLLKANKEYRIASWVEESAIKKSEKAFKLGSVRDSLAFIAGSMGGLSTAGAFLGTKTFLESDLRRRWTVINALQKRAESNKQKINSGIKTFLSGKRVATPVATKALMASPLSQKNEESKKPKPPANRQEAFQNMKTNIQHLQANPEKLLTNITKGTFAVNQYAPKATEMAIQKSLAALEFLASKVPQTRAPSLGAKQFDREYMPSSLELAKFERYVETVENPMSVVDDLQAGTLTREQVEALKYVFPNMYGQMQEMALAETAKPDTKLSYNQKIQLGILLDVPTDASLAPRSIQQLQASFQPQEEGAAPGAVNPTVSGLTQANFSGRLMTGSEKVATKA